MVARIKRLIQDEFHGDAWKVLVASTFLKRTRGVQVRKILTKFFRLYPVPERLIEEEDKHIQDLIKPLGFWRKRTQELRNIAVFLVENDAPRTRDEVLRINGVGRYVANAFSIFVLDDLEINPMDTQLRAYVESAR